MVYLERGSIPSPTIHPSKAKRSGRMGTDKHSGKMSSFIYLQDGRTRNEKDNFTPEWIKKWGLHEKTNRPMCKDKSKNVRIPPPILYKINTYDHKMNLKASEIM